MKAQAINTRVIDINKESRFPAPACVGRRLRSTACNEGTTPLVPLAALDSPNRGRRVACGSSARTQARTQATARPAGSPTLALGLLAQARGLEILAKLAARVALALMPAVAIVALAALAIANPGTAVVLQAALWAGGFLYLALAVESDRSGGAALNLGLGVTVQTLAWLSVEVAPELAVAAAVLVAARVAVAIFRRT